MFSRSIAVVFAAWLPAAALILPLGPAHTVNALISGTVATLLAAVSMAHDRARIAAAVVGAWVALTPFILRSTLLEEIVCVCWGTMMFTSLMGPFSESPRRSRQVAVQPAQAPATEQQIRVAA